MNNAWIDDLLDSLDEKLNNNLKFKTHKEKKMFVGDLKNFLRTSILANTQNTAQNNKSTVRGDHINILVPNKTAGHSTIRTQGDSERADDFREKNPPTNKAFVAKEIK